MQQISISTLSQVGVAMRRNSPLKVNVLVVSAMQKHSCREIPIDDIPYPFGNSRGKRRLILHRRKQLSLFWGLICFFPHRSKRFTSFFSSVFFMAIISA